MEKQYIFYGAGGYAKDNLSRLKGKGIVPVCFSDSDKNKHNKTFEDTEYKILPLDKAVGLYPDYEFVITVDVQYRMEVFEYLKNYGIKGSSIRFAEDVEFRKGCPLFMATLVVNPRRVQVCCTPLTDTRDFFLLPYESGSGESLKKAIDKYNENKNILRKKWLAGEESPCDKCTHLKEGLYSSVQEVKTIHFPTGFEGTRCNFKCCYCNASAAFENPEAFTNNLYETIVSLSQYFDFHNMIFSFSNGEFVARKDSHLILDYLYDKGAILSLTSNSSIYKEEVARFIRSGRINGINTSLDAGTRETFAKVKGVDCYEKVIENILTYSQMGCRYFLKYIILDGINDNESDINGFAEVCRQANAAEVTISTNMLQKSSRLSKNALDMTILLYNRLSEYIGKSKILFSSNNFNAEDWKIICSLIK